MPTLFDQPASNLTPQQQATLDFMQQRGSITDRQAEDELGIRRLSARIYDLKQAGYAIDKQMIRVRSRYEDGWTSVAEYWLATAD